MAPATMYFYSNSRRLAFEICSNWPSATGVLIAFFICTIVVIATIALSKRLRAIIALALIAYVAASALLLMTYSRGAIVAAALAVCFILRATRARPVLTVSFFLLSLTSTFLVPNALPRLLGILAWQGDGAVERRLSLWVAACRSISAHFPATVGLQRLSLENEAYWQPLGFYHHYPTAVNLPLTVYATYGWILYACLIICLWFLAKAALTVWHHCKCHFTLWSLAIWIVFFVANQFTVIDTEPLLCICVVAAIFVVWRLHSARLWQNLRPKIKELALLIFMLTIFIYAPLLIARLNPSNILIASPTTPTIPITVTTFTASEKRGVAFVIIQAENSEAYIRGSRIARAACQVGFDTQVLALDLETREAVLALEEFTKAKYPNTSLLCYVGIGETNPLTLRQTVKTLRECTNKTLFIAIAPTKCIKHDEQFTNNGNIRRGHGLGILEASIRSVETDIFIERASTVCDMETIIADFPKQEIAIVSWLSSEITNYEPN